MKTHCPQGHAYSEENTYLNNGSKQCKTCRRDRMRLRRPASGIGAGGINKAKTHCPKGHEYTEENTYVNPQGRRHCRSCAQVNSWVQRLKKYSITVKQYVDMLAGQNDACSICHRKFLTDVKEHIDHDHDCCKGSTSCGKCVRGILCPRCNYLLGFVKDSSEILESAVNYLQTWKNKQGISHD